MKAYTNVMVVSVDAKDTVYPCGYVRIDEDKIIAVGSMDAFTPVEHEVVIDMPGFIVMPGLINAHTHLGLIPLRSLRDDMPDRLRKYLFPMEQKYMSEDTVRNATRYGALESLLNGTTTLCDMYYYSDTVCEVLESIGIRALVGQTVVLESQIDYQNEMNALDKGEELLNKWKTHPLITPMIAPHGTTTVSEDALRRIHQLSVEYDAKVMMHVSEMDYEMDAFKPLTPLGFLESKGLLDHNFIAVHVIHTNKQDLDILARTRTTVVSCPGANMKAGKGIPDIKGMVEKGVHVGLGTDGPVSGNTLDMMSVMKLTGISQKTRNRDRALFSSKQLLRLATIEGARVLGLEEKVGSLEVGKKADMVFVDTKQANMYPIHDVEATLVYQLQTQNIHTVLVDGVVKVENHEIVGYDLVKVRETLEPVERSIREDVSLVA